MLAYKSRLSMINPTASAENSPPNITAIPPAKIGANSFAGILAMSASIVATIKLLAILGALWSFVTDAVRTCRTFRNFGSPYEHGTNASADVNIIKIQTQNINCAILVPTDIFLCSFDLCKDNLRFSVERVPVRPHLTKMNQVFC